MSRNAFPAQEAEEMRKMLSAMQSGEMTVSRGIELLDMWLAGNYTDEQLPPVRHGLAEDEMPWDRIDALTKRLAELDKQAEPATTVWRSSVCPDGVSNTITDMLPMGMKLYSRPPRPVCPQCEKAIDEAAGVKRVSTAEIEAPCSTFVSALRLEADELEASEVMKGPAGNYTATPTGADCKITDDFECVVNVTEVMK